MNKKLQFKSLLLLAAMLFGVSSAWATTVKKTMTEIVTANEFTISSGSDVTCYTSFSLDEIITISTTGNANCGSFWGTDSKDWRLYQNQSGNITITAAENYNLSSVTITYTVTNNGTLKDGDTTIKSGETQDISGSTITYTVGNTGTATNGQVRVKEISVTYSAEGESVKETATLSISSETIFSGNTATITTNGPAITLSTADASIATVSGTTITGVAAGSVKITATWSEGTVGDKTYAAGSQDFNVTVEENNSVTIDDQGNITFDFTKNYWSLPTDYVLDEESYTSSGYTITLKGTGDKGYKYGSSTGGEFLLFGKEGAYLTLPAFSFDVSKIVVTGNEGASGKTTQNIFVGETAVSTETTGVTATNTYEIASGYQEAGKVYTIKVTNANNSQITQIVVYKKTDDFVSTPTVSPEAGGYPSAQRVVLSCATADATIYYTLDGTEPDANSATYSTPISITTTTTIKAIAIKGTVTSSVLSATFTIVPLEHAGTEADPYTVADARNAIDASIGITEVYATGIVSEIVTAYSSQHGNISFNISTDGLTLQAYRCKGATGVDVSGVKPGDVVLVKGNLKKYNDIYEFDSGCELISLQHPVIPIISATPASLTELSYVAGYGPCSAKILSVTGENLKADITLSLEASSNFEISLTEDSGYGNSLTIRQTDGSVAATTVYVRLISGLTLGTYNGTITLASTDAAEKTISLTGSVEAANVTWDLSIASYEEITDEDVVTWSNEYATMTNSSKGGGTKASNYLGGDKTSSRFYSNNTLTITPTNGYEITSLVFTATTDNYASTLASSTWSNAVAKANATTVTVTPTDGTKTISAIIGGTCGFTAVKVYYEESSSVVENVKVNIPADSYTTFSNSYAINFSGSGITAYTAMVDGNVVKLKPISDKIVPANTGVILYAETAGEYTGVLTTGGSVSSNELVAATTETKVVYKNSNKFNYILQGGVFKKATGDMLKAGKAYLNTNYDVTANADGARELKIVVDGEATAIKAIETAADKNVYDLQGRKVAAPTKGLYIINGKKMIVK